MLTFHRSRETALAYLISHVRRMKVVLACILYFITLKSVCTQMFLHRKSFTHSSFSTEERVHTGKKDCSPVSALRPSFCAECSHLRSQNRNFSSVFGHRPSFRVACARLIFGHPHFRRMFHWTVWKSQFLRNCI